MTHGRSTEVESAVGRSCATASERIALRDIVRPLGRPIRSWPGIARRQAVHVPAGVPGHLRGHDGTLFSGALGSGVALQPGAAPRGLGIGTPGVQHPRRAAMARTGVAGAWAGPVAIVQAAIVSLVTFGVIYFSAKRSGLDPRLAATLGTGGAVCGVSGAIAIGGAVGAKKQDVSVAISLVVVWAIVMIFVLPLAARALHLSTGVAGAWIGTSEFADAAVTAFTLMKVIGRDVWIGVWAFALSLIVTTRWERTGIQSASPSGAGEIWRRFPKFVLGFLIASAIVTVISRGYDYAAYKKEVLTGFVAPLQALRTFAFFLSIGLTTRLREFVSVGARPFYAFTLGVIVNVALGFVLSTQVFNDFWNHLGQ